MAVPHNLDRGRRLPVTVHDLVEPTCAKEWLNRESVKVGLGVDEINRRARYSFYFRQRKEIEPGVWKLLGYFMEQPELRCDLIINFNNGASELIAL